MKRKEFITTAIKGLFSLPFLPKLSGFLSGSNNCENPVVDTPLSIDDPNNVIEAVEVSASRSLIEIYTKPDIPKSFRFTHRDLKTFGNYIKIENGKIKPILLHHMAYDFSNIKAVGVHHTIG